MKKILIVFAGVIVVVVVAVFLLLSNLDSVVAKAIEKHGSDFTKTSVFVSGVDISLREGRGSIKGLRVESPDGFDVRDAFLLGDITLDIDIKSLRNDPVVIDEIHINAPVVNAEILEDGTSNIHEIQKNVQAYTGGGKSDGEESGGQSKRIRIKKFVFEKGCIEVDATALDIDKRTITLPEIRLHDVGGANGATPDEITRIVLMAVTKKVASEIAGSEIDGLIRGKLEDSLTDKVKGLFDRSRN
jgi:uncharacterized protein involved in outer membrane biogenesis